MKKFIQKIKCYYGKHEWDEDKEKINGVWWRFCKHCIRRQMRKSKRDCWENF